MSKVIVALTNIVVWTTLIIMPYQSKGHVDHLEVGSWAKSTVVQGEQRKTVMQLYLHGVAKGESPTAIEVVPAPGSNQAFGGFGYMAMIDDPLRVGPDPDSKLVGRAQGLEGGASREGEEVSLIMVFTYTFSEGIFNGSSLSILGLNSIMNPVRELPVIGGTGVFRMARGYAFIRTHFSDTTSGILVIAHNFTIFHY